MKTCKAILFFSAAVLLSACGGNADTDKTELDDILTAKPIVKKNMSVSSTAMNGSVQYSIWLPPTYDEAKKYPVLYLLHGYEQNPADAHNKWLSTDSYGSFANGGNLSSIATQYVREGGVPFIIVTPNCPNDFYRDSPGGDQYETFFVDEFIPHIEKTYGGNGKRAIAGLSMGGYGTLYHGFLHPDMYTVMYAMSPATSIGWFEPQPTLESLVKQNASKNLPAITIETGIDDMTVSLTSVQEFVDKTRNEGVTLDFITRSGGHDWTFWQECLPKALRKAGNSFK